MTWKSLFTLFTIYQLQASRALDSPQPNTSPIPIIKYENPGVQADGSYSWNYETGNGIKAQESGYQLKSETPDQGGQYSEGSYEYTDPNGVVITVTYTAGPQGFVPSGAHLPTPPPIPEAIAKALEFLKTLPPSPEDSQGSSSTNYNQIAPANYNQGAYNPSPAASNNYNQAIAPSNNYAQASNNNYVHSPAPKNNPYQPSPQANYRTQRRTSY